MQFVLSLLGLYLADFVNFCRCLKNFINIFKKNIFYCNFLLFMLQRAHVNLLDLVLGNLQRRKFLEKLLYEDFYIPVVFYFTDPFSMKLFIC